MIVTKQILLSLPHIIDSGWPSNPGDHATLSRASLLWGSARRYSVRHRMISGTASRAPLSIGER